MRIDESLEWAIDLNGQELRAGDKVATTVKSYRELQVCTVARFTQHFVWVREQVGKAAVRKYLNQVVKVN